MIVEPSKMSLRLLDCASLSRFHFKWKEKCTRVHFIHKLEKELFMKSSCLILPSQVWSRERMSVRNWAVSNFHCSCWQRLASCLWFECDNKLFCGEKMAKKKKTKKHLNDASNIEWKFGPGNDALVHQDHDALRCTDDYFIITCVWFSDLRVPPHTDYIS